MSMTPEEHEAFDKRMAEQYPYSLNATQYQAAQRGEYSYETGTYTGPINSTNSRILSMQNPTSAKNTVKIPEGEPNATWTHEQLSDYYNQARQNGDWQKMQAANLMSNYIWDFSGHPENQQDASDDINYYKNLQDTLNKNLEGKTGDARWTLINNFLTTLDSRNGGKTSFVEPLNSPRSLGAYYTNEGNDDNRSFSNSSKAYKSFDADDDPLWQAYLDRYQQESDRAARNTIGEVAANTGGLASSYATTAANQAANYYTQLANDAYLDIYQQKYQEYLNDLNQQNTEEQQAQNKYYQNQQLQQAWAQLNQSQQQINNDLASAKWQQNYTQSSGDWSNLLNLAQLAAQNGNYDLLNALIKKMGY